MSECVRTMSCMPDGCSSLYSDLVEDAGCSGEALVRTQNAALRTQVRLLEEELLSVKVQLRNAEVSNTGLREVNAALERNISCLYKTAVMVRKGVRDDAHLRALGRSL